MPGEGKKRPDPESSLTPGSSLGERGPIADGAFGGRNRALLNRVSDMVTVSDREGRIVYANPATERVSGYSPEEFVARNPFDSMHPEDRSRCEEAFRKLRNTPGLSLDLEHRFRHKDGTWRWAEGTFDGLFDDPEIGGLVATVRDVTEKKRAEEALRESEEKYRTLVENVGAHAVFLLDKEGVVTEWTASAQRVKGYTAEEVVGRHVSPFYAPEEIQARNPERELSEAAEAGRAEREGWQARRILRPRRHADGRLLLGRGVGHTGPVGTQVYLAVREAIRNAVRHSGCSRIGLTLEVVDGELHGLVEDDEEGFDAGAVAEATPSWGVGLRSMRERAEMLGGSLRVDSEPGTGTRVELRVPLNGRSP